ncbi:uncharacterized protein LOC131949577 [Physella acuta]|uniref:uncharacterized protein LOC131949577 n=1 Tax=Physella acuta TaxID=109671 RepID=UPI0027DC9E3B|nr:uncharacterized protein LOC131949577 [Physella acuta]
MLPKKDQTPPLIADLSEVLADSAWNAFYSTFTPMQKLFLKRDHFEIKVPESYFAFDNVAVDTAEPETDATPQKQATLENVIVPPDSTKAETISLETIFGNDTDEKQSYKFRFEKTRKTVINVLIQKGFTFGGKANFSVGIPKQLKFGLETDLHYQLNTTDAHTFEESVMMEATSDICVGAHSCYVVNVELREVPIHYKFKFVTRMSMPLGSAPIYIHKKQNGEKVFTYVVRDLRDDVSNKKVTCSQDVIDSNGHVSKKTIDLVVEGVLKGVLACNHKILLRNDKTKQESKSLNTH